MHLRSVNSWLAATFQVMALCSCACAIAASATDSHAALSPEPIADLCLPGTNKCAQIGGGKTGCAATPTHCGKNLTCSCDDQSGSAACNCYK